MKKIKVIFTIILIFILTILITACNVDDKKAAKNTENISSREHILLNDNTNEIRNNLIREDIEYLRDELPKKHKNPFSVITKEEFGKKLSNLYNSVDKLNNSQVFIELGKIISSIGDGHTMTNYWDGKKYPLQFYIFDNEMYIVNADKSLEDMMYSKIISIDNIAYKDILSELIQQISYENESWLNQALSERLCPAYLYGLGIAKNGNSSVFEVEKDGKLKSFEVSILSYEQSADFCNNKASDKIIGKFEKYYDYTYIEIKSHCILSTMYVLTWRNKASRNSILRCLRILDLRVLKK